MDASHRHPYGHRLCTPPSTGPRGAFLAEPETDGPDEEEIQYSVAQIKEATKKLPAGYRIILSLYLFEGYDMEEIASILKIQPPSVRSQYLRAKRKLLDIIAAN